MSNQRVEQLEQYLRLVRGGGGGYDSDIKRELYAHIDWLLATARARASDRTARLREQIAFARGRCAALHELDLEDRELPCEECRKRGIDLYSSEPSNV